jgi:hypothetical protein
MDEATKQRRAEVARLLKGARWWNAEVQPSGNSAEGTVEWKLRELSTADLAARSPLRENGWTASRIARIERMERHAMPIELDMIERALGLPGLFDRVRPRTGLDLPTELTQLPPGHAPNVVRLPPPSSRRAAGTS